MTLLVDPREGSKQYADLLSSRGLPARLSPMTYGDVSWIGNGPDKSVLAVGVEIKTLRDLMKCIQDKRFAGAQLEGLQECYHIRYLLTVGSWRSGKSGELEVPRSQGWVNTQQAFGMRRVWMYREVQQWIASMTFPGGMHWLRACSESEAAAMLHAEYTWWTSKEYDEHKAHLASYESGLVQRKARFTKALLVERVVRLLPGLGEEKAMELARRIAPRTVEKLLEWTVKDWQGVAGIGETLAKRAWRALRVEE